jgi:hypothetical protein
MASHAASRTKVHEVPGIGTALIMYTSAVSIIRECEEKAKQIILWSACCDTGVVAGIYFGSR